MPKRYPRRYRVAALIREELAAALAADRRAGLVALREVKLSADCSQAKIYYTLIQSDGGGDEKSARARAAEFFEENSKRLRTRLARSAQMRATPTLTFIYDDESLQAEKIDPPAGFARPLKLADAGVVYNPPMGMLQDRKILITGVLNRRSIAYAIAQAAAREGASLAFTYQTGDKLRDKVSAIANEDFKGAPVFPCDAAQDDEIAQVFESLKKEWGTLDGFVHSIAFAGRESLVGDYHQTTTRAAFAQANDVSVYSLAAFARAAEPMLSADFAAVTLSYLGAIRAVPNYNLMGVAKAGLEASVRYLALGLGRRGARINAISAGPVRTLAAAGIAGFGKILSAVESAAPLRRNVRTEEIGNAAAFLLSPLSSGITGEIVYVDCGFHLTVGFPLAESPPAESTD